MTIDPGTMGLMGNPAVAGTGNMMIGNQWVFGPCGVLGPLQAGTWLILRQEDGSTDYDINLNEIDYDIWDGDNFIILNLLVDGFVMTYEAQAYLAYRLGDTTISTADWNCSSA